MFAAFKSSSINLISARLCSTSTSAVLKPFGKKISPKKFFFEVMYTVNRKNIFVSGLGRAIISGTVIKDQYVFENGATSFLLRSNDPKYGSTITRVHTNLNKNIVEGNQLYVQGNLYSSEFMNASNKHRNQIAVGATEISFIRSSNQDLNFVELRAAVCSDVINTNDFSMFRVITSYLPKLVACVFVVVAIAVVVVVVAIYLLKAPIVSLMHLDNEFELYEKCSSYK